ncbi:MAG: RtcB family protein [Oscillospiraceae bacterium]|nr:RtcB family protein [Oscillospiraceae bacterium]
MIELQGKYAAAKVFTDVVDAESISQVISLLNQPYAQGSRVRMMPDIHAGAGCTVGTTMTIRDKICPNLVGVDIGCGMETIRIKEKHLELQKLDKLIRAEIPSGFAIRTKPHRYADRIDLSELRCGKHVDLLRGEKSIGTLGGGNHFIEANRDDEGHLYIVVHSGSRRLGLEIAEYYQDAGCKALSGDTYVPRPLAYVEGELLDNYLHDMRIAQSFADINRQAMMDVLIKGMGLHVVERFTTIHNYIDLDHGILRKGAVSAQAGEKLLIPMNMRDGSLICIGKGNEDWNCSAPHGAGRLMSRSQAKQSFTVSEYKKQMQGIYTTSVGQNTLDECPMAYKPMESIVENIGPTADIQTVIRPIYNFKAGNGD